MGSSASRAATVASAPGRYIAGRRHRWRHRCGGYAERVTPAATAVVASHHECRVDAGSRPREKPRNGAATDDGCCSNKRKMPPLLFLDSLRHCIASCQCKLREEKCRGASGLRAKVRRLTLTLVGNEGFGGTLEGAPSWRISSIRLARAPSLSDEHEMLHPQVRGTGVELLSEGFTEQIAGNPYLCCGIATVRRSRRERTRGQSQLTQHTKNEGTGRRGHTHIETVSPSFIRCVLSTVTPQHGTHSLYCRQPRYCHKQGPDRKLIKVQLNLIASPSRRRADTKQERW